MALREPTPEEVSRLIDEGVILNEPGADLLTRWLTKTFAANPQEAKGFLERRGFEVMETDRAGKLQFAIRHPVLNELTGETDQGEWKVLDPEGFDKADIIDIAFDLFVVGPVVAYTTSMGVAAGGFIGGGAGTVGGGPGGGSGAGAVGGAAIGGAGMAAVGAGAVETARQGVGQALGVNEKTSTGGIRNTMLMSMVLPGLAARIARFPQAMLRLSKWSNKKLANIGRNLAGTIAGSSEADMVAASQSAARAARIRSESFETPIALLDRIRGRIQTLRDPSNKFPESIEIESLMETAREVPMKGVLKVLLQEGVSTPVGTQRTAVRNARTMAKQLAQRMGFDDAETAIAFDARVPATVAEEFKKIIQGQTDFSGRPGEKLLNSILKKAQGSLRNRIRQSLPSSEARARFDTLNGRASFTDKAGRFHQGTGVVGKMEALNEVNKKVGEHIKSGSAERFVETISGRGKSQEKRLLQQFDKLFGTAFVEEGTTSHLGKVFSKDAPKLTATGRFIGVGAGVAAGQKLAGTPGAIAGGAAAFEAMTPKGMVGVARGITKGEKAARKLIRVGGRALNSEIGVGGNKARAEVLADWLARRGGASAAAAAGRSTSREKRGQAAAKINLEPSADLSPEQQQAAMALLEEVNAIPGLTGKQRMDEFERRTEALLEGGIDPAQQGQIDEPAAAAGGPAQ